MLVYACEGIKKGTLTSQQMNKPLPIRPRRTMLQFLITTTPNKFDFAAFVDAQSALNLENLEDVSIFGIVSPSDMGEIRKTLKEDLKYVEAFSRNGYVGTVAGINLYTKKDAVKGTIIIATKEAVTLFNKKGTEVEQPPRGSDDANIRKNTILSRKYYLAALTDTTKVVKMSIGS